MPLADSISILRATSSSSNQTSNQSTTGFPNSLLGPRLPSQLLNQRQACRFQLSPVQYSQHVLRLLPSHARIHIAKMFHQARRVRIFEPKSCVFNCRSSTAIGPRLPWTVTAAGRSAVSPAFSIWLVSQVRPHPSWRASLDRGYLRALQESDTVLSNEVL